MDNVAINAISSVAFDNPSNFSLLLAQESVDEEVESNGTTIAECRPYSKLVGMKLNLVINGLVAGTRVRWMLLKRPDGENLASTLADANFHSSDDSPTLRELRATTMSKGFFVASDKTATRMSIFVKRQTLRRLGSLRENDRIVLAIAQSASDNAKLNGFGTLYVRMN